jgi:signal transduction histidine kinase
MPENEAQSLREPGLAFFGRILAGQTHELTNVLNVINELTGLEGDILAGVSPPAPPVEKLQRIVDKVRQQLVRGDALLRSLNRFAHSVDSPVAVFDLREALEQIIALAQRSARLARTELTPDFPAHSQSLETSPFGFQHAVFRCIELALAGSVQQRRIMVGFRLLDAGVQVTISSVDPMPASPEMDRERAFLELLVHELGGRVLSEPAADAAHRLSLFFPNRQRQSGGAGGNQARAGTEDTHAT